MNQDEPQNQKTNLWLLKGQVWGGGINWEFGIDIHTLFKIDNQQGPTV